MAGAAKGSGDKEMAAHLRAMGYPHGRRRSTTRATHNYPSPMDPPGTARYQRYLLRIQRRRHTP